MAHAGKELVLDLDAVIGCLAHHRQRATYGAVAAAVGTSSVGVGLMRGRAQNYLNSWVVSQKQHRPINYQMAQIDPELEHVPFVISDVDTLRRWLSTRLNPKDSAGTAQA
jgi:hypothetical protein